MLNSKNIQTKKFVEDGTYNAYITKFDAIPDCVMRNSTSDVIKSKFDLMVNGQEKEIDVLIFYSEAPNSYCAKVCEGIENSITKRCNYLEDFVGEFVDLSIANVNQENGTHFYRITGVAPFTGNKNDFQKSSGVKPQSIPNRNFGNVKRTTFDELLADDDEE